MLGGRILVDHLLTVKLANHHKLWTAIILKFLEVSRLIIKEVHSDTYQEEYILAIAADQELNEMTLYSTGQPSLRFQFTKVVVPVQTSQYSVVSLLIRLPLNELYSV